MMVEGGVISWACRGMGRVPTGSLVLYHGWPSGGVLVSCGSVQDSFRSGRMSD